MLIFPAWLVLVLRWAGYSVLALAGAGLMGYIFGGPIGFAALCVLVAAAIAVAGKEIGDDGNGNSRPN